MKDYYQILNVPRVASAEQVKKAFRALALRHHPDVAGLESRPDFFIELREAYETLSEPSRRKVYDVHLTAHRAPKAQPPQPAPQRKEHQPTSAPRRYIHQANLIQQPIHYTKWDLVTQLELSLEESISPLAFHLQLHAENSKHTLLSHGIVHLPAGLWHGARLLVEGLGTLNPHTGERGNLEIEISLKRHAQFQTIGNHVYSVVEVAPWQMALGATLSITTLEQKEKIKLVAGQFTPANIQLRQRGLYNASGMRGDFWIRFRVLPS